MPKTRNAFALRNFDNNIFTQYLLFSIRIKEIGFREVQNWKKDYSERREKLMALHDRIFRHIGRLRKYKIILLEKLSIVDDEKEYCRISEKKCRVLKLTQRYASFYSKTLMYLSEFSEDVLRLRKQLEENVLITFAERLKKIREEAHLTQTQLAEKLDMTQKIISCYENSRSAPSVQSLIALSLEFNRSTDWLLGLTD